MICAFEDHSHCGYSSSRAELGPVQRPAALQFPDFQIPLEFVCHCIPGTLLGMIRLVISILFIISAPTNFCITVTLSFSVVLSEAVFSISLGFYQHIFLFNLCSFFSKTTTYFFSVPPIPTFLGPRRSWSQSLLVQTSYSAGGCSGALQPID